MHGRTGRDKKKMPGKNFSYPNWFMNDPIIFSATASALTLY
jgi:hypothetical protein